jgi:hypothetical protein
MWVRRGPEQLAKCAEAASRRVAYPEELGSFYLSEEFQREDAENTPPPVDTPTQPVAPAPQPVAVPAVNHAPATPTNDPRPDEKAPEPPKKTRKAAKDTKIEEVILDKVEVVTEPETGKEEIHVTVTVPAVEEPEPVQKMDKPAASERCRTLIGAGVNKDNLKAYVLKKSEKADTKSLTAAEWDAVLTPLEESLATDGKDAVNKIIF